MSSPKAAARDVRRLRRASAVAMLAIPPGLEPMPRAQDSVPRTGARSRPVKMMSRKTVPVRYTSVAGSPSERTAESLAHAWRGADFSFPASRVGGMGGRACDERIPLAEGVLGQETVGAGGVLYGLRTLPVAVAIAERVAAVAPQAWVINFTNPAG